MNKKFAIQQHQSQSLASNRAYSDYRSASRKNGQDSVNEFKDSPGGSTENFSSVTKYLNSKEAKLLKNNLGLFEFPEAWDIRLDDESIKH